MSDVPTTPLPPPPALPVQALAYTLPSREQRPGIVTAIGVISIVVASLSGLYSLYSGLQGFGFYMVAMVSSKQKASPWMTAPAPAVQVIPTTAPGASGPPGATPAPASPFAMTPAERKRATEALAERQPMGPRRQAQLDAILTMAGKTLGTDAVSESGIAEDSRSGEKGPTYFVTVRGRLEVWDDRAVFFPDDNTPTIRASAGAAQAKAGDAEEDADATGTAVPTTIGAVGSLTAVEIQAVVNQAQSVSGNKLNPSHVTSLQSILSNPTQQLVPPGTATGSVRASIVQPNGTMVMTFVNGSTLILGPQGNVISQTTPMPMIAPSFSMSPWVVAAYLALSVVGLGLAVLLLVAGIMVTARSPRARRLHLIYACVKIPVALGGGLAFAWLMGQLMGSVAAATPGATATTNTVVLVWGLVLGGVGCIYPVALLIALNARSVREYYNSVAAGG